MLLFHPELRGHLADESGLCGRFLYGCDSRASARQEFERHGAGAGEEVECRRLVTFEVNEVLENVEDILAGEIGGRSCCYVGRYVEAPASEFSTDYAHGQCK